MWKKGMALVALLLIIFLASEVILPSMAGRKVREEIIANTDNIEELKVKAEVFPAFKVLFSRLDHLSVEADGLEKDDLFFKEIKAGYSQILLADDGEIMAYNNDLKVILTETAINDYIDRRYPELKNFQVNLESDRVFMEGYLNVFDSKIQISLTGEFNLKTPAKIQFIPVDFQLNDLRVPSSIIKNYLEDLVFTLDLEQLEIPITVEEIKVGEDRLLLLSGVYLEQMEVEHGE